MLTTSNHSVSQPPDPRVDSLEDCEHVAFHRCASDRNGARVVVTALALAADSRDMALDVPYEAE